METIREKHRILAQNGDYHALVAVNDRANEIPDSYMVCLLKWAESVWDWAAVVTQNENRAEQIRPAESGSVCYDLSNDDLKGLFGGKYGGSPGPLPGYLEDPDSWDNLQAAVWVPLGRFSAEVRAELLGRRWPEPWC